MVKFPRLLIFSFIFLLALNYISYHPTAAQTNGNNCSAVSLNPFASFSNAEANYLSYITNTASTIQQITVNSADVFQYGSFTTGAATVAQFNSVFPPTSTANLPRLYLPEGNVVSFYAAAGDLSDTQLAAVQDLYARDLVSRRNYGFNLANLGRYLTGIRNTANGAANQAAIDATIENLRAAYNTLSDTNAAAANPRAIYKQVAATYNQLKLKPQPGSVNGLAILAIGASNYDTNRLPVPGANNTVANTTCNGCFPLADFDVARNQPLSTAQANPVGVFGDNVIKYLNILGINVNNRNTIDYQVNSADQLQFVSLPINDFIYAPNINARGLRLSFFFASGFPGTLATSPPQTAIIGDSRVPAATLAYNPSLQAVLTNYYNNPANAGRRNNYGVNLRNLICAFSQLSTATSGPGNSPRAKEAIRNSLQLLTEAQSRLQNGGVPDILAIYLKLGANLALITPNPLQRNNNTATGFDATLNAIRSSLLPIGVINYYNVPLTQSLGQL
jgi:hypothetical protein